MTLDEHKELACLVLKIACALPAGGPFHHLRRRLALCALAGDHGETLYWLRVTRLARAAPAPLVARALALVPATSPRRAARRAA